MLPLFESILQSRMQVWNFADFQSAFEAICGTIGTFRREFLGMLSKVRSFLVT